MTNYSLILLACISSSLLAGCDTNPPDQVIYGTLERDRLELSFESSEPVITIQMHEGDQVKHGDVLMQQDQSRILLALEYAHAQSEVSKARLAAAVSGPRSHEIERARARVDAARSAMQTSNLELDRAKELIDHNFADQNQVDVLQGRADEASARLMETKALVAELLEGTRSELVDEARYALKQALARIKDLEFSLERTRLIAPRDGTIEAVPLETGERPAPSGIAVILAVSNTAHARIYIPQTMRAQVQPGMLASVTIDGYQQAFPATLRWVSTTAAFSPYLSLNQQDRSRLAYLAEVDLLNQTARTEKLPSGMPVEVSFEAISMPGPE